MDQKVKLYNVGKGSRVSLSKTLPNNRNFGNSYPLREFSRGDVISEGFEAGILRVKFDSLYGAENVKFNELSAREYLLTDIY